MASKGKEVQNFIKIGLLVVGHMQNAFVNVLTYYLLRNNMSFVDFIGKHIKDIKYLKKTNYLRNGDVSKLIIGDEVISDIKETDLEGMLVRNLLVNFCSELFMDGSTTLQDFLEKNQHDIYHLFNFNEPCCQCPQDYKFPVKIQLLEKYQYEKMFNLLTCAKCTVTSGKVCSVSSCIAPEYIKCDNIIRCRIFGHFSPLFKSMQKLKDLRDNAFAHLNTTEIENHIYDGNRKDIEEHIMVLARLCGKEYEMRRDLDDLQKQVVVIGENRQDMELQEVLEQMRKMKLNKDIYDGVVLHADEDKDAAIEFIEDMKMENPDLDIDIIIYGNLTPVLGVVTELFDSFRFVFVFVTKNFVKSPVAGYLGEIAMMETLEIESKNHRFIPVLRDENCYVSWLRPIISLRYDNYLKDKKSQQGPYQTFINCFKNLITDGKLKYLVN